MKKTIKTFILIFTFILCVSLIGGAYALYVKNADSLEISFSANNTVIIGYSMKVFDSSGNLTETIQLEAQSGGEYKAEYLADAGYKVEFYHDGQLLNYGDDYYSAVKGNNYTYYNRYTVYLKTTTQTTYIGADENYYLFLSTDHNLQANTRMTKNPGNTSEVMITNVYITAGTKFTIKQCNNYYNGVKSGVDLSFYVKHGSPYNDIEITQTGTYSFYFDTTADGYNNALWIAKN